MNNWVHTVTQRLQAVLAMWAPPRPGPIPVDQQATLDAPAAPAAYAAPAALEPLPAATPPPVAPPAQAWQASHTVQGPWAVAAGTWVGRRHAQHGLLCEDTAAWRITPGGAAHLVVADGVSSGARGDVASAALAGHVLALEPAYLMPADLSAASPTLGPGESAQDALAQQVLASDAVVQAALAAASPGRSGAATFAAVWLDAQGQGWYSRVGDCRLYRWRWQRGVGGRPALTLTQASQDQTFVALGEPPPPGVPPYNPARMVGNGCIGAPEVLALQLAAGDGLLLCSDGVHDVLSVEVLQRVVAHGLQRGRPLQSVARLLARLARSSGSRDDIGIAMAVYQPGGASPASPATPTTNRH